MFIIINISYIYPTTSNAHSLKTTQVTRLTGSQVQYGMRLVFETLEFRSFGD